MLNETSNIERHSLIVLTLCLVLTIVMCCFFPDSNEAEGVFMSVAYAQPLEASAAAETTIGSETVTFSTEPVGSSTDCIWTLEVDSDKMSSWLTNRVKEKNISEYLLLTIDGNKCTVTALQYFRYGIKYTTYYKLTATSVSNPSLSAVCYITLG